MPPDLLDPTVRRVITELDALAPSAPASFGELNPEEAREWFGVLRKILGNGADGPSVASVVDGEVTAPEGHVVPTRTYKMTSRKTQPSKVVVHLHGGGWVVGDLDSGDYVARALAMQLDATVVSVDYRLAPEHPFPAAFNDASAVVRAVAKAYPHATIAVSGDSAGANLAAALAARSRVEPDLRINAQLLFYPALDPMQQEASQDVFAEGYILTRDDMAYYWNSYLPAERDRIDPRASPYRLSDLTGLPPAVIITAGFDPLRDEGRLYAERLVAAGIPTTYLPFAALTHGFLDMAGRVPAAYDAMGVTLRVFAALLELAH
jgi:acetyl esterase